jgi:outer membrane protein TolC
MNLSLKSISTEEKYGRKTLIDVLDIRREYHNAKINMTIAEITGILAFYKVEQTLGELDPVGLKLINKN